MFSLKPINLVANARVNGHKNLRKYFTRYPRDCEKNSKLLQTTHFVDVRKNSKLFHVLSRPHRRKENEFVGTRFIESITNMKDLNCINSNGISDKSNGHISHENSNNTYHSKDHVVEPTKNGRSPDKMATLIDGKKIAEKIRHELKADIADWIQKGHRAPQLTAVLIGEDPASCTYVNNKMKAALEVGINSITRKIAPTISEEELLQLIDELNNDDGVDGILVQLPVPPHINERNICNSISCDKDVDGFNEKNVGRLCLDMNTLIPCTPLGVQVLLKETKIDTFGKNAVVVGRSKNVGMPIAMLLHADGENATEAMDATVTICHRFTPPSELAKYCKMADIIVTATGVPGLIKADMVKPGACVIDVGLTRITDPVTGKPKLVGDCDFNVRDVAGHITPVPGGVGPMTVTMLMKNTFIAAKNLAKKKVPSVQNNS